MHVIVGKQYKNKKHQTIYHVLGYKLCSETLDVMVEYERVEPEERQAYPFVRPMKLFKEKFEPIN